MKYSFNDFVILKKKKNSFNVSILSSSMEPWIHKNESIKIKSASTDQLKPYDIVVFWKNDILICHVYIKSLNGYIITQSLNTKNYDTPTNEFFVLGVVTEPRFKWYHKALFKYL